MEKILLHLTSVEEQKTTQAQNLSNPTPQRFQAFMGAFSGNKQKHTNPSRPKMETVFISLYSHTLDNALTLAARY